MNEEKSAFLKILCVLSICISVMVLIFIALNYSSKNNSDIVYAEEPFTLNLYYVGSNDMYSHECYELYNEYQIVELTCYKTFGGYTCDYKLLIKCDGEDVSSSYNYNDFYISFEYGYNWEIYIFELIVGKSSIIGPEIPFIEEFSNLPNSVWDVDMYLTFIEENYPECIDSVLSIIDRYGLEYLDKYGSEQFLNNDLQSTYIIDWWDNHPEYIDWREEYKIDENFGGK